MAIFCATHIAAAATAFRTLIPAAPFIAAGMFDLEMLVKQASPQFNSRLAEVRAAFEEHVREEEDVAFPQLVSTLSDEESKELTNRMNREGFKVA